MPDNFLSMDTEASARLSRGGEEESLPSILKRLSTVVENYAAKRDGALMLMPKTNEQISSFLTIVRALTDTAPGLSAEGVSSLSSGLRKLQIAVEGVLALPSDTLIGDLLNAYEGVVAPYVLLADVQSQIRELLVVGREQIRGSFEELKEDANAVVVQSIRAAQEERRRLEGETERLSKNLLEDLRAGGESVIAAVRTDVSEHVLQNAQNEFASAGTRASRDVRWWAVVTTTMLAGFVVFAWYLLKSQEGLFVTHPSWTWQFIYIGALRLTLLAALAAFGSFCLRMLKRHIHIRHAVAYKCRILKSVPGLLVASSLDNRYSTLQIIIGALLSEKELAVQDDNPESLSINIPKMPSGKSREGGAA